MERFDKASAQSTPKRPAKAQDANGRTVGDVAAPHQGRGHVDSPSGEASVEEPPVGQASVTNEQKIQERSKYEAAEVYRSKKGDRFS